MTIDRDKLREAVEYFDDNKNELPGLYGALIWKAARAYLEQGDLKLRIETRPAGAGPTLSKHYFGHLQYNTGKGWIDVPIVDAPVMKGEK